MSDANYPQFVDPNQAGGWQSIKLRDIGDGTYAIAQTNVGAWDDTRISTIATTTVKSGAGVLGSVIVNKAVSASTITIYDNTSATGTIMALIAHPLTLLASQYMLTYNAKFANGLTIVTSGADDITITSI